MTRATTYGLTALAVLFAALLAHHLWGHGGHFGFDDMHYARWAKLFAEGRFRTTDDHYTFRWGLIAPLGLAYRLFGVSDHSSAVTALLATLLTLWCVWLLTASLPVPARVWAMAFTAFSEWVFFYSNKIMPDVLVMFWVTAAVTVWFGQMRHTLLASEPDQRQQGWAWRPAATVAALFAAFLSKESVFLVVPLFVYLLISDVLQGKNRRYWLLTTVFGAVSLIAYLIWCAAVLGHPLARAQAISANSYFNPCSYDQLPIAHTLRRIGYELWGVFLNTGVLLGAVFALPALFSRKIRTWLAPRTERDYLLFLGLVMVLLSNFMSTSPKAYIPLCVDIRHYLFAVPFVAAAAAVGVVEWLEARARWQSILILGLTVAATAWSWLHYPEGLYVYVAMIPVWLLCWWTRSQPLVCALLFLPLLVKPVLVMRNAFQSNYPTQKALVHQYLKENPTKNTLVITNPAECNIDAYLLGFDSANVQFVPFKALTPEMATRADSIVLILNGLTAWMSNMDWEDYPAWVREGESERVLIEKQDGVEWFGVRRPLHLR